MVCLDRSFMRPRSLVYAPKIRTNKERPKREALGKAHMTGAWDGISSKG
jgi:hypothetical protein